MSDKIRSFVSIEFPDNVVKEIARIQGEVEKLKFQGKLTELENLHLTLKFLGSISKEKVSEIEERLGKIKFSEMDLKLGKVGLFKIRGNPKIVWIKIEGKGIFDLQKAVDSALDGLYGPEEHFMSHLTIARVKYVKNKERFERRILGIKTRDVRFKIDDFKLKKSELKKLGPSYETLEEFRAQ